MDGLVSLASGVAFLVFMEALFTLFRRVLTEGIR